MNLIEKTCSEMTDYYIDQIHYLAENGMIDEAKAVYDEMREWIESPGEHEVFSCGYLN